MISEDQWKAIVDCDSAYDGQFYYAVKTTGIFCRPSCKSRAPLRGNVVVFTSVDDAIASGFRPCKRCTPEQFRSPAEELAYAAAAYLDEHYNEPLTWKRIAEDMHISQYHIHRIFKRVLGTTPVEYVHKKRMMEARRLLRETGCSMVHIALSVGFVNVAHFSTAFRRYTGLSPSGYRNRQQTSD